MEWCSNDDKVELEDQFILRLPKEEAQYIHEMMQTKPKKIKKALKIELDEDLINGTVFVKKKAIPATLVSLPTVIESSKTVNKINLYKTTAISQMLLCGEQTEKPQPATGTTNGMADGIAQRITYPHGLTPPMKNVRRQRFRKTMKNHEDVKEAADVQKEVSLLLRMDYDAVSSRFEILTPNNNNPEEVTETMLFGAVSSSDSDGSSTSLYDIMDFNN